MDHILATVTIFWPELLYSGQGWPE